MSRRSDIPARFLFEDAIRNADSISKRARLYALVLASYMDRDGVCWPAEGHLNDRWGLGHKAQDYARRELEDAGLLEVQYRRGPCGTHRYRAAIWNLKPSEDRARARTNDDDERPSARSSDASARSAMHDEPLTTYKVGGGGTSATPRPDEPAGPLPILDADSRRRAREAFEEIRSRMPTRAQGLGMGDDIGAELVRLLDLGWPSSLIADRVNTSWVGVRSHAGVLLARLRKLGPLNDDERNEAAEHWLYRYRWSKLDADAELRDRFPWVGSIWGKHPRWPAHGRLVRDWDEALADSLLERPAWADAVEELYCEGLRDGRLRPDPLWPDDRPIIVRDRWPDHAAKPDEEEADELALENYIDGSGRQSAATGAAIAKAIRYMRLNLGRLLDAIDAADPKANEDAIRERNRIRSRFGLPPVGGPPSQPNPAPTSQEDF